MGFISKTGEKLESPRELVKSESTGRAQSRVGQTRSQEPGAVCKHYRVLPLQVEALPELSKARPARVWGLTLPEVRVWQNSG
jgi:hypothetical protein